MPICLVKFTVLLQYQFQNICRIYYIESPLCVPAALCMSCSFGSLCRSYYVTDTAKSTSSFQSGQLVLHIKENATGDSQEVSVVRLEVLLIFSFRPVFVYKKLFVPF